MHLLWKDPPQTITQLTKTLGEKKGWNKNIIITYIGLILSPNYIITKYFSYLYIFS